MDSGHHYVLFEKENVKRISFFRCTANESSSGKAQAFAKLYETFQVKFVYARKLILNKYSTTNQLRQQDVLYKKGAVFLCIIANYPYFPQIRPLHLQSRQLSFPNGSAHPNSRVRNVS